MSSSEPAVIIKGGEPDFSALRRLWEDRASWISDRAFMSMVTFNLLCFSALILFFRLSWIYFLFYISTIITLTKRIAAGPNYEHNMKENQLKGKIVVVTGASNGIGQMTAFKLAQLGPSKLILAVRGGDKRAEDTAAEMKKELADHHSKAGEDQPEILGFNCDLMDLKTVKLFCDRVVTELNGAGIDILVLNAGAFQLPREKTVDGFDQLMSTNVIGHHYMAELLMPHVLKSDMKRIVVTSSSAINLVNPSVKLRWAQLCEYVDPHLVQRLHYAQTKLANVYMVREYHKRFEKDGLRIYAVHPGFVHTNIQSTMKNPHDIWRYRLMRTLALFFGRNVEQGCQVLLYCSLDPKAIPGGYHFDCKNAPLTKLALDDKVSASYFEDLDKVLQTVKSKMFMSGTLG